MYLTLDIEKQARPIIRSGENVNLALRFMQSLAEWLKSSLSNNLDNFILTTEGFHKHVTELNDTDSRLLLDKTGDVIRWFDKLQEQFDRINFMDDVELKEKFKYAQKSLFKLEALAHVQTTKNVPIEKTQNFLQEGIAKLSKEAIGSALSQA